MLVKYKNILRLYRGKGVRMEYTKPVVLAQNSKQQSFAAGCPPKDASWSGNGQQCKNCERTT